MDKLPSIDWLHWRKGFERLAQSDSPKKGSAQSQGAMPFSMRAELFTWTHISDMKL